MIISNKLREYTRRITLGTIANLFVIIGVLAGVELLDGCKDNPIVDPPPTKVKATVSFTSLFDGAPFKVISASIGEVQTAGGNAVRFSRIKFLLSNVELLKENGTSQKVEGYGLIDCSKDTGNYVSASVPAGSYSGIRFLVGLDSTVNFGNPNQWAVTHPLSPARNKMYWDWQLGYIFMVLEGDYQKVLGGWDGFSYHIALLENGTTITINKPFTVGANGATIPVGFEVNELFKNPNTFFIDGSNNFDHSTPGSPIIRALTQNMKDAFTIGTVR
ncbi:MAG: hypothetical protein JNL32_15775 [Candidatus Kapabacteria bacterium]|nr:hypothetical protein [Candidatus Kapabacteria bacterium]